MLHARPDVVVLGDAAGGRGGCRGSARPETLRPWVSSGDSPRAKSVPVRARRRCARCSASCSRRHMRLPVRLVVHRALSAQSRQTTPKLTCNEALTARVALAGQVSWICTPNRPAPHRSADHRHASFSGLLVRCRARPGLPEDLDRGFSGWRIWRTLAEGDCSRSGGGGRAGLPDAVGVFQGISNKRS